jgi:hypothetical protein
MTNVGFESSGLLCRGVQRTVFQGILLQHMARHTWSGSGHLTATLEPLEMGHYIGVASLGKHY